MGSDVPLLSVASWGRFTGSDDICFPVSMFVHILEFKMKQEGMSNDHNMIETALACIPDDNSVPSAAWKATILDEDGSIIPKTWEEFRDEITNVFGSKLGYTLSEKLTLLRYECINFAIPLLYLLVLKSRSSISLTL